MLLVRLDIRVKVIHILRGIKCEVNLVCRLCAVVSDMRVGVAHSSRYSPNGVNNNNNNNNITLLDSKEDRDLDRRPVPRTLMEILLMAQHPATQEWEEIHSNSKVHHRQSKISSTLRTRFVVREMNKQHTQLNYVR